MSSGKPERYRLTPRALLDLEGIWRFSAETWSIERADRYVDELVRTFEAIAAMPTLAREHVEFTPPVGIHIHESYLIVYVIAEGHIAVMRLLGGRQDWASILKAADL